MTGLWELQLTLTETKCEKGPILHNQLENKVHIDSLDV